MLRKARECWRSNPTPNEQQHRAEQKSQAPCKEGYAFFTKQALRPTEIPSTLQEIS